MKNYPIYGETSKLLKFLTHILYIGLVVVSLIIIGSLFFNVSIAHAQDSVTIDESGEGISQALLQFYLVNKGLDQSSAEVKMLEQIRNPVFYSGGKIQDLVHIGDSISLDDDGNVVSFQRTSNIAGGRLPEVLSTLDNNRIKFEDEIIDLPEGVTVKVIESPIDQHNNLVIIDSTGAQYRVIGYAATQNALVNAEPVILRDWAKTVLGGEVLTAVGGPEEDIIDFGDLAIEDEEVVEEEEEVMEEGEDLDTGEEEEAMEDEGDEEEAEDQVAGAGFLSLSGLSWFVIIAIVAVLILLIWYFRKDETDKKGEIDFTKPQR